MGPKARPERYTSIHLLIRKSSLICQFLITERLDTGRYGWETMLGLEDLLGTGGGGKTCQRKRSDDV